MNATVGVDGNRRENSRRMSVMEQQCFSAARTWRPRDRMNKSARKARKVLEGVCFIQKALLSTDL